MMQIVSAERVAALRNKRLNLSSTSERTLQSRQLMSPVGGFCCKSQLRQTAKRDSVVLTRFSAGSIHDGPSEE